MFGNTGLGTWERCQTDLVTPAGFCSLGSAGFTGTEDPWGSAGTKPEQDLPVSWPADIWDGSNLYCAPRD